MSDPSSATREIYPASNSFRCSGSRHAALIKSCACCAFCMTSSVIPLDAHNASASVSAGTAIPQATHFRQAASVHSHSASIRVRAEPVFLSISQDDNKDSVAVSWLTSHSLTHFIFTVHPDYDAKAGSPVISIWILPLTIAFGAIVQLGLIPAEANGPIITVPDEFLTLKLRVAGVVIRSVNS